MDSGLPSSQSHDTQADSSELDSQQPAADSARPEILEDPKSTELSSEFVGKWSQLISSTNWEKGRIIHEWRQALMGSESPASTYSDEAWSRRVGGVTPQHVGRLRRVFERFEDSYKSFDGLYWSHFLAALDWDDAEMWLEGAVQSTWSVSQMRRTRWESMGSKPNDEPQAGDVVAASEDEDFTPLAEVDSDTDFQDGARSVAEGPRAEDPDFGEESEAVGPAASAAAMDDDDDLPWDTDAATPQESPFAQLPSLPVDLAEALEQFKLAIIRHRADEWAEISQADVIKSLDALRAFAAL